jgi:acetyl-CoA C-acetyltransferase
MTTGLGWYSTKHSVGIWSNEPPAHGFRYENVQNQVDVLPQRAPAPNTGDAIEGEIETYTVMVGHDGEPDLGIVVLITADGARAWGTVPDVDTLSSLMTEEGCGRRARIRADGRTEVR